MDAVRLVAGGVILNARGQVCLTSQRGTSYALPKGGVDTGEDMITAAKREIEEETGLTQLTYIHAFDAYRRYPMGPHNEDDTARPINEIHYFLFTTDQKKLDPTDPHNPHAYWVDLDTAETMITHARDKAFYRSILSTLRDFVAKHVVQ